jgi:hypothetical protein
MARFVISYRLAFRDSSSRLASVATFDAATARLGRQRSLVASEPRGLLSRRVAHLDLEPGDLETLRDKWGPEVIAEPLAPRHPMALTPSAFRSTATTLAASGPSLGSGSRIRVTFRGGGDPIERANTQLVLVAADGSGQTASSAGTTDEEGLVTYSFDATRWIPAQVSILPRASFWGWVTPQPKDGLMVEVPDLPKTGPLGWWHEAVGISSFDPQRGAGVRIGVIDTGVGPHPYLSQVEGVGSIINGVFAAGAKEALDVDEHGTHVSGILASRPVSESPEFAGIAPGASVFVVRVFAPGGGGASQGDIAEAIDLLSQQYRVDLINLSLGSPQSSEIEQDAIAYAAEQGTLCIAAAGNSFGQPILFPAAYEVTVAVSAIGVVGLPPDGSVAARSYPPLQSQGLIGNTYIANFCNAGPNLLCCAPGVGIISTAPALQVVPAPYIDLSGTSMACPVTCATLATQLAVDPSYLALPRGLGRAQHASRVLQTTLRRLGFPQSMGGQGLSLGR